MISTIKRILVVTVAIVALSCNKTQVADSEENSQELPLSIQLCLSEMQRTPHAVNLDFRTKPKWNYSTGVELYAMLKAAGKYNNQKVFEYVYSYPDSLVNPDGTIFGYKQDEYNIDHVNSGKLLFTLYDITHEQRFVEAANLLRKQMYTHPRTQEGGWWHKKIYEHQMWLDGLYMGAPFVAEWASRNQENVAWDVLRQFTIVGKHTYDPNTKLYRHAWDESKQMFWADKETGVSEHAWGRANGWYMMAMTDVLEFVSDSAKGRSEVLEIYNNLAQSLLNYRDTATGMWFQVLDCPTRGDMYKDNYVESTCSAMFIYSFLKGARLGYLPKQFLQIGQEAYKQFVDTFVKKNEDGTVSLTKCCAVAGLGGKDNRRDGTYGYYLSEPVRDNDPKGIGPFILASLEVE